MENWLLLSFFALVVWGAYMFAPKIAVEKLGSVAVVMAYQGLGAALFTAILAIYAVPGITIDPVGIGLSYLIGICGTGGQLTYILSVRKGPLTLVSVVTSLYPALTMVMAVLILSEKISVLQGAGAVLALIALCFLVAGGKNQNGEPHGKAWIWPAAITTVIWSLWAFLPKIAVKTLEPEEVLLFELFGTMTVILCVLATLKFKVPKSRDGLMFATIPSFLNMIAILAYLHALEEGPVSVVAVLTALYPAVTIVLAQIFLGEKMTKGQTAACLLAFGSIGMMAF